MSSEDVLLLCEYILETQLGEHILQPIGRIFIRSGPLSITNIVDRAECSREHALNVITVLIKHNLLNIELSTMKNAHFYSFNQQECLMRLSFPRFMALAIKSDKFGTKDMIRMAIMREVFLDGSLLKSELAQVIVR